MKSSTSVSSCSTSTSRGRRRYERPSAHDFAGHGLLAALTRDLAAHVIGETPERDLIQPSARIFGNSIARPLRRRRDQRFLHGVLGGGKSRASARRRRAPAAWSRDATPIFPPRKTPSGSVDRRGDAVAVARNSEIRAEGCVTSRSGVSPITCGAKSRVSAARKQSRTKSGRSRRSYRRRPRRSIVNEDDTLALLFMCCHRR